MEYLRVSKDPDAKTDPTTKDPRPVNSEPCRLVPIPPRFAAACGPCRNKHPNPLSCGGCSRFANSLILPPHMVVRHCFATGGWGSSGALDATYFLPPCFFYFLHTFCEESPNNHSAEMALRRIGMPLP